MKYFKDLGNQLSGEFEAIGRVISERLGRGIAGGSGSAQKALQTMNEDLLASQKQYMDEKSLLEQKMEAETEAKYRREYEQKLKKAKTVEQAEIIRQNESYRLQKKADERYMTALEEHLKNVEEKVKAQKEAIVSEFNEIAERAADSMEELDRAVSRMEEKMTGYGQLFRTKKTTFLNSGFKGSKEVFEDTLLDLSAERATLETYRALLQQIKEHEQIPQELFRVIRDMSVEDAVQYQTALLSLGEAELEHYLEDWKAIQELSRRTAEESYAEELQGMLSTLDRELEAWYGTVPDGFFEEGQLSAEAFGEGFMKKLQGLQETLQEAVFSVLSNSFAVAESAASQSVNNVNQHNTVTYVLNSSGETVAEQLRSVRGHAAVSKLRGDFSGASV